MDSFFASISPVAQLVTIFGACMAFLFTIVKVSMRVAALELKVDTMWGFQMRRSMSEVATTGIGKMNSPLQFSDEAVERLEPIRDELVSWYKTRPPHERRGDASLLIGIEQEFGDRLLNMICIPCGLSYGACLLVALFVAKGSTDLNLRVSRDRT